MNKGLKACLCGSAAGLMLWAAPAAAKEFGPWGAVQNIEALPGSGQNINTPQYNDGCPILSPMDDSLYIATNRQPGVAGAGNDIFVAPRVGDAWGDPVSIGAPVNSLSNDFCPTPVRGNKLYFVSSRGNSDPNNGDIYLAKLGPKGERIIRKLPDTINTSFPEWSPSYYQDEQGNDVLYFSRQDATGAHDIYMSVNEGPATRVNELSSAGSDARPNVRHDGLEIVWDSTRGGLTAPNVWTARRSSTSAPWEQLDDIDVTISSMAETRASLSWDGTILLFGSNRLSGTAASDIFIARREKLTGQR